MSTFAPEALEAVRTCTECLGEFPETLEFFHTTGHGYLRRSCVTCVAQYDKERQRKHRSRTDLGLLPAAPLAALLRRMLAAWLAEDKSFDDFAETVELRPRSLYRVLHESRHVQFDVADRVLTNTAYSIHDLYPEYRDD